MGGRLGGVCGIALLVALAGLTSCAQPEIAATAPSDPPVEESSEGRVLSPAQSLPQSDGIPEQVRLRSRWVPVLSWAGPWRSLGRWWDGEGSADRYQIVTSTGAYLCEVREGTTYLLGVYD